MSLNKETKPIKMSTMCVWNRNALSQIKNVAMLVKRKEKRVNILNVSAVRFNNVGAQRPHKRKNSIA